MVVASTHLAGVVITWGGQHHCHWHVMDGSGDQHLLGWGCHHCYWAGVVDGHIVGQCNTGGQQ